ncbi:hypothetical protein PF010_g21708 [Phytophthora fragariae]|uniref:Uncharacterized protein n=1 Tax=Phytophthora fragariae TaxID=53985 RepID=A0A6A3QXS6_9STRA|nr:hypothetical protein PF003_g22151 [Phytophthora fragariae]KAE8927103.1 hypothetical protein PF009_g22725 [Phytophthora fragariae]KAE9082139.1 hypothetical protein PF010_g21708 [Phytophthora fragariae]KAE9083508.1 hypothetical protein PF007_g21869 [Phytophthora fragariae]KAE9107584.1 hypothetical protein PF006_g21075 [Phytophthora fragariae]
MLQEALEIIFTTECLVTTAYLETMVPFCYSWYTTVIIKLPSSRYHMELSGVTRDNIDSTIVPIQVFGLLHTASFALLVALVKRNCGIRALHQLAFVLETQRSLIQAKVMFWIVMTVCFRVIHFGSSIAVLHTSSTVT